jgi:hypothetical protein
MNERYISRGVGVAMVSLVSLALFGTAALMTMGMTRCPEAGASAFRALPMVTSVLPLLSALPSAWRRVLTWRGLFNVAMVLFAAQLVFALAACRAVLLP